MVKTGVEIFIEESSDNLLSIYVNVYFFFDLNVVRKEKKSFNFCLLSNSSFRDLTFDFFSSPFPLL